MGRGVVISKKAEINLSSREKKRLEELVSTYRNDLYVKTYKDKAIQSQLDSIVEKEEIESYFEQNKLNFKTNKDLAWAIRALAK